MIGILSRAARRSVVFPLAAALVIGGGTSVHASNSVTNRNVAVSTSSLHEVQFNPVKLQEFAARRLRFRVRDVPKRAQAFALLRRHRRQYRCLNNIIMHESSWRVHAENPYSGAYGIPQALPGWKMAEKIFNVNRFGSRIGHVYNGHRWSNVSYVQLFWMIKRYIPSRYGTACGAWSYWLANGSY